MIICSNSLHLVLKLYGMHPDQYTSSSSAALYSANCDAVLGISADAEAGEEDGDSEDWPISENDPSLQERRIG